MCSISVVTLWITVIICRDVSCRTRCPPTYREIVGAGLPIARHRIVIEPPSEMMSDGCTVGGSTYAGSAGSVQATSVSEGRLVPLAPIATTYTMCCVFGSRLLIRTHSNRVSMTV
uniref:Secreted protein n=1 Tax=Anopheles darlingi TaxID=43151 RepID=A0A2M4DKZ3_ANODA